MPATNPQLARRYGSRGLGSPARRVMQPFATRFSAMGGGGEIAICAPDRDSATAAFQAAAREILRIEAKYSRYRQDSIISQINRSAGQVGCIECDRETLSLLECAEQFYTLSGGLFDITSGVLRRAWDFRNRQVPSPEILEPLLALVGWEHAERSPQGLRLPLAGMEIDLGGIGKEYAADQAAKILAARGIAHGYVNLGGDIAVVGPQPDGEPWPIGVQNPRQRGAIAAHIPLMRGGLTTSGDSEKFFEIGGKRYCHILNPKTGFPVSHWASVSVADSSALAAGALSTIALLKEADALTFLRQQAATFLAIDIDGQIFTSQTTSTETLP